MRGSGFALGVWCNWQHGGFWYRCSWFESRYPSQRKTPARAGVFLVYSTIAKASGAPSSQVRIPCHDCPSPVSRMARTPSTAMRGVASGMHARSPGSRRWRYRRRGRTSRSRAHHRRRCWPGEWTRPVATRPYTAPRMSATRRRRSTRACCSSPNDYHGCGSSWTTTCAGADSARTRSSPASSN